ncbi:hypothetical protein [Streptomyces malaysiensis]|uniref:Uncharacterized protein n=1 Tax=Streptomyces malaysiensis subsp. samsunensis TaxID=459658 RepID=A0A9X2M8A6_STRMQ|nr:hypothetical protein [Streptomyces samsunensis]MCQ8834844.1 hypothetical protein [Streptomyces samsunensis]
MNPPPMGTDLWSSLPPSWQERALGLAVEHTIGVFDGVAGAAGPWWPARPVVLREAFYRDLGELADRLGELVLRTCMRRARTAGELQDVLGLPDSEVPMLRRDEPLGEHLLAASRPDVVLASGTPKFLEVNIEGAVAGTAQADLVSRRFLDLYEQELPTRGFAAPPSAVDARFAQIRAQFDHDPTVAIPLYQYGILAGATNEDERIDRHRPMVESARRQGITAFPCPWRDLHNDAEYRLFAGDRQVDAVLRLFVTSSEPSCDGLTAVIESARRGTIHLHTSEATWLLSNKTVLAWLWTDIDELPPADRQFVHEHVPFTVMASPEHEQIVSEAAAEQTQWVLKPVHGHGGAGILLGHTQPAEVWRAALKAAMDTKDHVLQRLVRADQLEMTFLDDRTRQLHTQPVPFVLGPLMFDRKISNVFVRHSAPGGGLIVNAQQGSAVNSVLLTPS